MSNALTLGTRINASNYTHRRMNPDHMHFYFFVQLMILHQLNIECSAKHGADVSLSMLASQYSFRGPENTHLRKCSIIRTFETASVV
jgi:hypothetical protein